MTSILTNNAAMVALQTLKSINSNLSSIQNEISTGKKVATAKDNSAMFAISKVMEADVKGFQAISDSLALGESTVAVASNASETITNLLLEIKGNVVAAQEENVDRAKIQADIDVLRDQIGSVASAAQFNGLNLLSNTDTTAGSGTVDILGSLDRAGDGTVTASSITVNKNDLGTAQADINAGTTVAAGAGTTISGALDAASVVAVAGATTPNTTTLVIDSTTAGTGVEIAISGAGTAGPPANLLLAGFNDTTGAVSAVARDGESQEAFAERLAASFNSYVADQVAAGNIGDGFGISAAVTAVDGTTGAATITFTGGNDADSDFSLQAIESTGATIGGGLEDLATLDVTTDAAADEALANIETMIQTAIDAAADFGAARNRIETQSDFVSKLTDSFKSGIGSLVDANLEESSARLQALQVQQQLGVQALSIANSAPQTVLSLFRG
ncbi:MAG: flagellin [Pseudomonadota bacterium]